jgi:hypothetical protein
MYELETLWPSPRALVLKTNYNSSKNKFYRHSRHGSLLSRILTFHKNGSEDCGEGRAPHLEIRNIYRVFQMEFYTVL